MKQIFLSLLLLTGIWFQVRSQLTVADNNNVGIGVSAPVSKFAIDGAGSIYSNLFIENNTQTTNQKTATFYKSASGGSWSYGIQSQIALSGSGTRMIGATFIAYNTTPLTTKRSFGLYSYAGNATDGYNYGVWARVLGSNNGAALFATSGTNTEIYIDGLYAGYFRGDVLVENNLKVEGTITENSDINLKKDIRYLSDEKASHIEKLKTLSAIKYKLKNPAELNDFDPQVLDTIKVDPRTKEYNDPKYTEDRIGLSAQDVQEVYPELVKQGNDGYLQMNYIGLIPILLEGLKEQEAEIEVLRKEIEKLQEVDSSK